MKKIFLSFAALCMVASVYSCRETEKKAEDAATEIEETVEETKEKVEDAADTVKEAAEEVADSLGQD